MSMSRRSRNLAAVSFPVRRAVGWGPLVVLLLAAAGCDVLNEAPTKKVGSPGGLSPLGMDLDQPGVAGGNAGGNPAPAPAPQGGSIIGKTTARVVDSQVAKQNPNVSVVQRPNLGNDPLSMSLNAYVSIRARASTLGLQQSVAVFKAENDRYPSYDEFIQMMRQHNIEFTELYPYQMYGYDSSLGAIEVLEDSALKAEVYSQAGLNPDGTPK